MPVDKQVFMRYKVLNRCFRNRNRCYTIDDLVKECNAELGRVYDTKVSKRTIQNDISILEADYHIRLKENFRQGHKRLYRYEDIDYTLPIFRINDNERLKIRAAVDVLEYYEGEPMYDWARTLLMQIDGGLFGSDSTPVVSFQSNPDLKGIDHFIGLLNAILSKRTLKMAYTPYGKETRSVIVYPYHLKQYNNRWFLIARRQGYDGYANYALDRIERFEETSLPFVESEDDFSEYFDDVIGITVPEDEEAEDIFIKVRSPRYNYVKTKPLHLSQRVIEEKADYTIISINVKVNKELEALLLSYGPDVEVLAPEDFRDHMAEMVKSMFQQYTGK